MMFADYIFALRSSLAGIANAVAGECMFEVYRLQN